MKKILANIILIMGLLATYCEAALKIVPPYDLNQLQFVGKTNTSDIYIIKKSDLIHDNNKNLREVIILFNEIEPYKVEEDNVIINSQVNLYILDCQNTKFLVRESYLYDEHFGRGNVVYASQSEEWQTMKEQNSLLTMTKESVCKKHK